MENQSRLNKSIKNLQVAWIGQFLNIFAKFVMRRVFVRYISDDYLGLDALFTNIIGLMNLADLGLGTVISYALYKPLAEQDEDKVLGVMQLLTKVYRRIALILCAAGLLLMPLITVIAPEAKSLSNVHLLFGLYVANTCVSYLFTYKGALASADQNNYITLRNHYVFIVGLNLTQIFIIYFTRDFLIYAVVQSLFTIAEGVSLSFIMDRKYPMLKRKEKIALPKNEIAKIWSNVRKIVVGKIGNTVISSTDNLILSNVVGLSETGVYSNYTLVSISLQAIVWQLYAAVSASIGNIAAMGERKKEIDYFWSFNFITTALYTVTSVCMFNLMQPFVAYWLGGDYMMDYGVLLCVTVVYYLTGIRGLFGTFSMAHGMFELEAKKTIAEALVNLIVSVVLAWRLGLIGVLLGTIVSSAFIGLPLELMNVGRALPEISKRRFAKELLIYSGGAAAVLFFSMRLCGMVSMHWYIRLPLGFVISVVVFIAVWWAMFGRTKMFRRTMALAKEIVKERLGRRQYL